MFFFGSTSLESRASVCSIPLWAPCRVATAARFERRTRHRSHALLCHLARSKSVTAFADPVHCAKSPDDHSRPKTLPKLYSPKRSATSRAMSVPGDWCPQKWSVVGGRRYYRDEVPSARCCGSSGLESAAARVSSPPPADPVPFFTRRR